MVATDIKMGSYMESTMARLSMLHSHIKERSDDEVVPTFPHLPRQERELLMKSSFQSLLKNLSLPSRSRHIPNHTVNSASIAFEGIDGPATIHKNLASIRHSSSCGLSQDVGHLLGINQSSAMVVVKTGSELQMVDILTGKNNKVAYFAIDKFTEGSRKAKEAHSGNLELQNHESLTLFFGLDNETVRQTLEEEDYDTIILEYGNAVNYKELIESINHFGDRMNVILHISSDTKVPTISDFDADFVFFSTTNDGTLIIDLNNSNLQKELKNSQFDTQVESGIIQVLSEPFEIERKKIYRIYDHVRELLRTEKKD